MPYENNRRSLALFAISVAALLSFGARCDAITGADDDDDSALLSGVALAAIASQSGPIYMFHDSNSDNGYNGNLGGRSGADAKCSARKTAAFSTLSCTNVRAWLSVSSSDSIANMPTNYGVPTTTIVYSSNGTKIADNWNDLLDGTVADTTSLGAAGLFSDVTGGVPYYWTGSNSNNGNANLTCSEWSNGTSGTGDAVDSTNNGGFVGSEPQNCNSATDAGGNAMSIVCVCF